MNVRPHAERLGPGLPRSVRLHQRAARRLAPAGWTNNVNTQYFNNPAYNKKMEVAARLSGAARLSAYGNLDNDIMKNQAPMAPYIVTNARLFVSQDVGCYTFSPVNATTNLVAVCKK